MSLLSLFAVRLAILIALGATVPLWLSVALTLCAVLYLISSFAPASA